MTETPDETKPEWPVATPVEGGLYVDFSGFYGRKIDYYGFFPMGRKRNFLNMAGESAAALNMLLRDPDFAMGMLALRFSTSLPEGDPDHVTAAEFPQRLFELFNEAAAAAIKGAVQDAYTAAEVDIDTEHAGKNEELQFTNGHALIILQWSRACIAAAPLVTAFMEERDIETRDAPTLLMECFAALLRRFEPQDGSVDILAKLKKLVESRVIQTRYSDKVIWNFLRNVATDPALFADRLYRKFVTEGVPKLQQGTNIIKFFHAFLKFQIKYQFHVKFALQYRPTRSNVMDGEGVSAMEHLEAELIRRDEGASVVGEIAVATAIRDALAEVVELPDAASRRAFGEEVVHWSRLLSPPQGSINDWQRGMVTKFFLPRIGQASAVRTRTLEEYATMMLVTRAWMVQNDMPILADYMGARLVEGADGRRLASRKRFVRDFMDSAQYKEILETYYGPSSQAIVDSQVIVNMIAGVHVNVFHRLPELGEGEAYVPAPVEHRIEAVAQEILRFVAHAARSPN
jgi:hypothetical protein